MYLYRPRLDLHIFPTHFQLVLVEGYQDCVLRALSWDLVDIIRLWFQDTITNITPPQMKFRWEVLYGTFLKPYFNFFILSVTRLKEYTAILMDLSLSKDSSSQLFTSISKAVFLEIISESFYGFVLWAFTNFELTIKRCFESHQSCSWPKCSVNII